MINYFQNFGYGTIGTLLTSGATTLVMNSGHNFPVDASKYFKLILWDAATYPNPANDTNLEIVTARYSGTLNQYTITRAEENTTAVAHAVGHSCAMTITAAIMTQANASRPSSILYTGFGGDGSDGDVVISSNTDISNTVKQYNNLTVNAGVILTAQNCIIGVKGTLTLNGTITATGGGYSGGSGNGVVGTSATGNMNLIIGGGGGGGGGLTASFGGNGGTAGGAGGAGTKASTAGSGSDSPSTRVDFFKASTQALYSLSSFKGAGGGAGRMGNPSFAQGGNGGGFLYIECTVFIGNTGSYLLAQGDNGANGPGFNGFMDGGNGGGGGGFIAVRGLTISVNNTTYNVAGGSGGSGANGGGAGGAGGAGGYAVVAY